MKDYYLLLGIDSRATKADIKKNYRLLANKFHPDKNSDPGAAEKFIAITEAYEVLSDKKSRAAFDLYRWQQIKQDQKSKDYDYGIVVPPAVSPRMRRTNSQRERSKDYHEAESDQQKSILLAKESLIVVGGYVFHLLGISIFSVILFSAVVSLPNVFQFNFLRGLIITAFIAGVIYCVYWIIHNAIQNLEVDLNNVTAFYSVPKKRAVRVTYTLSAVFILLLVLFIKFRF